MKRKSLGEQGGINEDVPNSAHVLGQVEQGNARDIVAKKLNLRSGHEVDRAAENLARYNTKSDVMEWIDSYQDARRNMKEAERIYVKDKISARIIKEKNEKKKLEGNKLGADVTNGKISVSDQMDGKRSSHTLPTHTREQRAKLAGVSSGTVSRYDAVMKSDNEELKKSMLSGEKTISAAYKEITKPKENLFILS